MNTLGADIYHGDYPVDFHALASAGVKFLWHKATQGVGMIDGCFAGARPRARAVGVPMGAYHFFTADDPQAQARHFVSHASPAPGDLLPALDVETAFPGVGAAALACALEIKALCGHCPIIYASDSFWTDHLAAHFDADWTRWIARYGGPPHNACDFHQFSETGQVAGIPHGLDLNHFLGADLAAHVIK